MNFKTKTITEFFHSSPSSYFSILGSLLFLPESFLVQESARWWEGSLLYCCTCFLLNIFLELAPISQGPGWGYMGIFILTAHSHSMRLTLPIKYVQYLSPRDNRPRPFSLLSCLSSFFCCWISDHTSFYLQLIISNSSIRID
jgi:hypothetical protein